eukprot:gene12838-27068_t
MNLMQPTAESNQLIMKKYAQIICRRHIPGAQPEILLGIKKYGFGKGKIVTFGGKIENGETEDSASIRELFEECHLISKSVKRRGILTFEMSDHNMILHMTIFECNDFIGDAIETNEMIPLWFAENNIPFENMWPDSKLWLPHFMSPQDFEG